MLIFSNQLNAHIPHYDNISSINMEIYRNNKLIGFHKYEFSRDDKDLNIKNEVSFKITKLGVDLYKYYASGVETYKNGKFTKERPGTVVKSVKDEEKTLEFIN